MLPKLMGPCRRDFTSADRRAKKLSLNCVGNCFVEPSVKCQMESSSQLAKSRAHVEIALLKEGRWVTCRPAALFIRKLSRPPWSGEIFSNLQARCFNCVLAIVRVRFVFNLPVTCPFAELFGILARAAKFEVEGLTRFPGRAVCWNACRLARKS